MNPVSIARDGLDNENIKKMTTKKELRESIERLESIVNMTRAAVIELYTSIKNMSENNSEIIEIMESIVNDVQLIERIEVLQNTLNSCFDEELQTLIEQNTKHEANINDIDKYMSELDSRIAKLEKTKKK